MNIPVHEYHTSESFMWRACWSMLKTSLHMSLSCTGEAEMNYWKKKILLQTELLSKSDLQCHKVLRDGVPPSFNPLLLRVAPPLLGNKLTNGCTVMWGILIPVSSPNPPCKTLSQFVWFFLFFILCALEYILEYRWDLMQSVSGLFDFDRPSSAPLPGVLISTGLAADTQLAGACTLSGP